MRLVSQKTSNFYWTFLLIVAFKNFYCRIYCYFVCLLLSWSRTYWMTAPKFNNSWPLYLNFLKMINFCPNMWFIQSLTCQQVLFWEKNRQNTQIFYFLRNHHFLKGGSIDMNVVVFSKTSMGFLKSEVLQLFSKYS